VSVVSAALSIVRRITVVIAIAVAFLFGVGTTVYLSLRSPEVTVPDVVGKDRFEAERTLSDAGLNFRIRSTRPSNQANPDVVLFQLPRAGEVVKVGQTVAMDISRVAKVGETPETVKPVEEPSDNKNTSANDNKPKRNKNANKNENENSNANGNANGNRNANANGNANRPANANRPNANAAAEDVPTPPRANVNRPESTEPAARPTGTPNETRRPATVRPSPATPAPTRTPRQQL
jgi:beta-lactam-binding protein with PASTA domain